MYKKFFISTVLVSYLAASQEYKDVIVYSKLVEQQNNKVTLNGFVRIEYDEKIVTAKHGTYYFDSNKLLLEGDVVIIDKKRGEEINAQRLTLFTKEKHFIFHKFFRIDKNDIWLRAKKAEKLKKRYFFYNAIFSSCNINNPDWKIKFKKAVYDLDKKKLKLYGAVPYIKSIPFFYFPYLPIYLSKERRSGFLYPFFSYNQNDGFLYSQPYFWAISKSKDLEIVPQIRTKRGYGVYATYRFVDEKDSFGKIRVGYFKDKNKYTLSHNLAYNHHYGIEFYYKNNSLFDGLNKKGFSNKLYINGTIFSDNEYFSLQGHDRIYHHTIGNFYENRINYFIKNKTFFSGLYFKYYKDTTTNDNSKTLQILPQFQIHLPTKTFLLPNFYYNANLLITNFTRKKGTKAFKVQGKLPVGFHVSLFNDYLSINLEEELVATGYDFYNVPLNEKKYSSVVLNTKLDFYSDLVKKYKNATHFIFFNATLTKSKFLSEHWMKYQEIPKNLKNEFVDFVPTKTTATLRMHHYYLRDDNSLKINYILESNYDVDANEFRDLNQEFWIDYKNWHFYSKLNYSFLYHKATDIYNSLSYSSKDFGLSLGFLWKKDILNFKTINKEIDISGYYNYSSNLHFQANAAYNLKDRHIKTWRIGTLYKRKCWSINFVFGQDIRPVIKSGGKKGSITNNFFSIQLKILPFGIGN